MKEEEINLPPRLLQEEELTEFLEAMKSTEAQRIEEKKRKENHLFAAKGIFTLLTNYGRGKRQRT